MKHRFYHCAAISLMLLANITATVAADRQVVAGHLRPATVASPSLAPLGAAVQLDLVIGLPLRNRSALTNLLGDIYNPASANFHRYLTPQEFADQFAPTEEDYQAVMSFAKSHNFTMKGTHPNRTLLDVSGSVADIESAFHVKMHVYQHPKEARTFYAPDVEPSVDLAVPLLAINGLDNYIVPQPAAHPGTNTTPITPGAGTGPSGNYLGQDFRTAYAPGVTLTGAGQVVGLLELDGYYTNDIASYRALAGIPNIPMVNVLLDGATGKPIGSSDSIGEVSLDIEMVLAMAPGLSQLIVYEAPNCCYYWVDILNRMATDNLAKQLSTSWLVGDNPSADQVYQQMAAQGQSFFQCSGDYGAYFPGISQSADSPYFTTVGATTLTTGAGASWASETAWSNYADNQGVQSTGGGISLNGYGIPPWQQGINMTTNQGSATQRNVPDVAMVGDRIWVIWDKGSSNWWWGTSCAAPLWAGFAALVNQQAAQNQQPPIGFINPAVYALGKGPNYAACFHDIATGNNTNSNVTTNYFAVPGYDLCTGWGTPTGSNLVNALAPNYSPRIMPFGGFTSAGAVGGPFNLTSQVYVLTNATASALNWSLGNAAAWLSASAAGGALAGGQSTTVTISLSGNAAALPAGNYNATIWFTNLTAGVAQGRMFALQVGQGLIQNGGFETGDFSGWNVSGPLHANGISTNSLYAHSGTYGARLGPPDSLGYLAQTVPTFPGAAYLISCWLDSPDGDTPNEFQVTWNGATLFDQTNLPTLGWTNFQFVATAAGGTTLLQFGFENDPSYFGFDDVSVIPVPPPNFQAVFPSNSALTFVWHTLNGLNYQLQYKSNLTSGAWSNLGGVLHASGATLATTDGLTNGRRFYRVMLLP